MTVDDCITPQGRAKGRVRSWEFQLGTGWRKPTYTSAGIAHEIGFGSSCSESHVTAEVNRLLNSCDCSHILWSSLVSAVPDISYLSPRDLERLLRRIQASGLLLRPEPPELPELVGRESREEIHP